MKSKMNNLWFYQFLVILPKNIDEKEQFSSTRKIF